VAQQQPVGRLVYGRDFSAEMERVAQLPESEQAMVYLTAYRLTRLAAQKNPDDAELRRRSHRLLLARSTIAVSTEFDFDEPDRAEDGHRSRRVQLGAGIYDDEAFVSLALRPAFHHLTDNVSGYSRGAQINFFDAQVNVWQDQGLRLERLDILDIRSLSPRDRYLKPWSWQVRTGVERFYEGEDLRPLHPHLQAAFGPSYALGDSALWYVMPGFSLEYQRRLENAWQLAPALQVGFLWQTRRYNILLHAEQQWFVDVNRDRRQLGVSVNRALADNHGLQVDFRHQRGLSGYASQGGSVSWLYYF
jgi:hypothetical protein